MSHHKNQKISHSETGEITTNCRATALEHYFQLFAKGLFPIMLEEYSGTFRVMLPADAQS